MKKLLWIIVFAGFLVRVYAQNAPHDYSNWMSFNEKKLAKLAEKGDAYAAFELGNRYQTGVLHMSGILTGYNTSHAQPDFAKAIFYYHKAADLGYSDANSEMQLGYRYQSQNKQESLFWLARAGEHGSLASLILLGDTYYQGLGVSRNEAQADIWWNKALDHAVDANNAYLQYRVGRLYLSLRRDTNNAILQLKRAAANGNTDAMQLLGEMNRDGLGGVPKNAVYAQQWFAQKQAFLQKQREDLAAAQAAEAAQADQAAQVAEDTGDSADTSQQPTQGVLGAFVNALGAATANADPNGIQNTANQQTANIQAAQAAAAHAVQQGDASSHNKDCPTAAQRAANPKLTCLAR